MLVLNPEQGLIEQVRINEDDLESALSLDPADIYRDHLVAFALGAVRRAKERLESWQAANLI